MIVDLLCSDNYNNYNVEIARVLGLDCAVYISTLLNIYNKAIRKKKLVDNKFIKVDRKYVEKRTTFTAKKQRELDKQLCLIEVIQIKESDVVLIDVEILASLLISTDENMKKHISVTVKPTKKTKQDKIKEDLRAYINTTNAELRDAYSDWIDAVIQKQGWMSKQSVIIGQQLIDKFSNHNLDIALALINTASVNAYRDMQWAINSYVDNRNKNMSTIKLTNAFLDNSTNKPVKVTDEVF